MCCMYDYGMCPTAVRGLRLYSTTLFYIESMISQFQNDTNVKTACITLFPTCLPISLHFVNDYQNIISSKTHRS